MYPYKFTQAERHNLDDPQNLIDYCMKFRRDLKGLAKKVKSWRKASVHFPHREFYLELFAMGFLEPWIHPEEFGPRGALEAKLAWAIEISRMWPSMHLSTSGFSLFLEHLMAAGTPDQIRMVVESLLSGELGAWGLTGEGSGTAPQISGLKAQLMPDGRWKLNGARWYVTGGVSALWFILMARTGESLDELTAFLVRADTPGLTVKGVEKVCMRGSETAEVNCADVILGAEAVVGEVGKALAKVKPNLTKGRFYFGIGALGTALAIQEAVPQFLKDRKTTVNGKIVLILDLPETQEKLRLIAEGVQLIESLFAEAIEVALKGDDRQTHLASSAAKVHAARVLKYVADVGAEACGGACVLVEEEISDLWTSAQVYRVGEGCEGLLDRMLAEKGKACLPVISMMAQVSFFFFRWMRLLFGLW